MSKSKNFTDGDYVVAPNEPEFPETVEKTETVISGFLIESKPVPKRTSNNGTLNYPIGHLTPDSDLSFLVPATADTVKQVTASVRQYAYRHEFSVRLRSEEGGVRVWRTLKSNREETATEGAEVTA